MAHVYLASLLTSLRIRIAAALRPSNTFFVMLPNLIIALYVLLPITLLTSYSLPSGVFYALVASCLALLVQMRFAGAAQQTYRYRWLIASYSVLFLAVAASSIYYGDWAGANSEGALRLFLGLWLLILTLPHIDQIKLQNALWGLLAAGLVAVGILSWLIVSTDVRPSTPGRILTTYTSIMLLLGAISVFSLKWDLTASSKLEKAIKILIALGTFISFLFSDTRTGLLGLPIFVLIALILFVGIKKPKQVVLLFSLLVALLTVAVSSNDSLRSRIAQGIHEVETCHLEEGPHYSSMCIRLQLWRSAIDAGVNHPWLGLGDGGRYPEYLQTVAAKKGLVAQGVIAEGFGEPHNDLLLYFAGFGLPGMIGLLLAYLVPVFYFLPRLLNVDSSPKAKAAAAMGLAVCLGFLLFGLTETMFRRMNTVGFYVALVALFMTLSGDKVEYSNSSRQRSGGRETV
ncbi:O-antigen ligase family protein [Pusillimonas minor]|uniref:O-antigen ligase family protein n=1 Tax=Pusillimonas minor TaxID=2697024 RepID=A0A842HNT3_9BURK|nr:O-antigen ligase family protein [Pusillimonas minor]MBC2770559.1 O-antigen ligase family protein [Pusillimonas minor]